MVSLFCFFRRLRRCRAVSFIGDSRFVIFFSFEFESLEAMWDFGKFEREGGRDRGIEREGERRMF